MSADARTELVVLVDEDGRAVGTAPKAEVHHTSTPLHLAFSCYVLDDEGRVLLTRRALHKVTWPGAWTNTVCGHPGPDEPVVDAVRRRSAQELGLRLGDVRLVLPGFRYRAQMPDGVVENEICPVFTASPLTAPTPDPDEVDDLEWVPWPDFRADVLTGRREVTPWCLEQVGALPEDVAGAAEADSDLLPPAARLAL